MKVLSTEEQAAVFAAGVTAAAALKRHAPHALHELAGLGYIITTVSPTYQDLAEWQRAAGLPTLDQQGYEEALAAAAGFASLAFATNGETQN